MIQLRIYVNLTGFYFAQNKQTTNSVALNPQAKYTDWSTATGWRILMPTLGRGQRGGSPTAVNLSFLGRSRYFFFEVVPHLSSRS
jgi:hypothetical protein